MKFTVTLFALCLLFVGSVYAQDEAPEERIGFDKSKLFFGGNLGASFGDFTLVNVSPQVGYRFNNFLAAGAGINFIYNNLKYRDYNNDLQYRESYGYTGFNIFGRVYPINVVFLQVQPELNYSWGTIKSYNPSAETKLSNEFVPSFLVAGGAAIPAGRGAFIAMLQYDLLQQARSPYGTKPFLSFGYNIGF